MKPWKSVLAIPLLVLGAGCGGDDPDADLVVRDTLAETPAVTQAPPATTTPASPAGGMTETAQLQAVQNSGVGGEATITGRGNQTEVMVRLTGGTPNASHPGHIHSGTCEAIGGVVQALQPITADASGAGTVTATVDVPSATVMNGQHIIVYHAPGGAPATCARIPAHAM